jgi:hypothetical protein
VRMKRPPRQYPVTITRNDKEYRGTYEVTGTRRPGLWVKVWYGLHSTETHLGSLEAEGLARQLLGELVTKYASESD